MVKLPALRRRLALRISLRRNVRSPNRCLYRSCIRNLCALRAGSEDLAQALTAFTRAIRAHRRLARFAPEFFDATELNKVARRRVEDAEWRAIWEAALNRIYGPSDPELRSDSFDGLPRLPASPRTCQAIERELAHWEFWMRIGPLALDRYGRRGSRASLSLHQIARLLKIALDFGRLACGSPHAQESGESSRTNQAILELERAYGRPSAHLETEPDPTAGPPIVAPSPPCLPLAPNPLMTNAISFNAPW